MVYYFTLTRPVGQAVKTLASHAENMGSIPVRVTKIKSTTKVVLFILSTRSHRIQSITVLVRDWVRKFDERTFHARMGTPRRI